MKKCLSVILLMAILLSCCACGNGAGSTEPTLDPASPEALYGHIDQTKAVDGYNKIWNAEGVKFMMAQTSGKFELLCNIDMQGETLTPIQGFNGTIKGGNFTISNFTLQGGDETDFGFITVNKGNVSNMTISNVTFIPGPNAKNIGALAGVNEGKLNRCNAVGTMVVDQAAANAACGAIVGHNAGTLSNVVSTVDLTYNAAGAAKVGGLTGIAQGGAVEFVENHGKLTVNGNDKTVGLFAGEATDVVFQKCVFGGADNSLNGKLFTNFTGNADDDELVTVVGGKWRDNGAIKPLSQNVTELRQKVVSVMYDLCTVEWHLERDLTHSCTCSLSACYGVYNSVYTYYGIPYNHKSSSLARFTYCLNEDKTIVDWFYDLESYDGFDIYIGADCSSTVQQAWWSVSNSTNLCNTNYIPPAYNHGTIAVGDYICDFEMTTQVRDGVNTIYTAEYLEANEEQVIYESYAAARPGDAIVNRVAAGGHTRMVAENPVIIRNQAGQIDPTYSYLITHEQGATWTDDVNMVASSCKVNWQYTFAALYGDAYIPVTCEELLTGEMEPAEAELQGKCDGFGGMLTGTVKANYQLDYVTLTITNAKGEVILDHPMFTTCQKNGDYGGAYFTARYYTDYMDMAEFAVVLSRVGFESGQTYNYTVTANLSTFDNIPVHEGSFTYGG